jgi:hypothetical protein
MIRIETREQVKSMVGEYPDGISLTQLHNKVQRIVTRLQLRTMLGTLYTNGEISRERVKTLNRKETKYYPFNGMPPVRRKRKPKTENDGKILTMKDFMLGGNYQAYIEP